jgi:hypothetical protein
VSDLREILDRFAEEGEPRGATTVFADAVNAAGHRRKRRRNRAVVITASALVLAICGVVVAATARHDGIRLRTKDSGPSSTVPSVSVDRLVAGHWEGLPNAPIAGRGLASVVWTGRELLVWGGASNTRITRLYADGAAYDARTRSWRRLPAAPLSARDAQATVWTGTEMVIWGGQALGTRMNDGAAYDPATNRWRKLRSAPLKTRGNTFAVWSGDRVIVFSDEPAGVAAYDPTADRWSEVPPPESSHGHSLGWFRAVPTTSGRLLAWSHWENRTQITENSYEVDGGTDVFAYDGATNEWRTVPTSPDAIPTVAEAFWTGEDVLVRGDGISCWGCRGQRPSREISASYDPVANTWTRLPDDPLAKQPSQAGGFVSAWAGSALWSFNAIRSEEGTHLQPGDTSLYDPITRHWTRLDRAPSGCTMQPQPIWTGTQVLLFCPNGTSGGLAYVAAPPSISAPPSSASGRGDPAVWSISSHDDVTSASRSFTAYVTRLGCNGGVTGEVLRPTVDERDTLIVVTFTVKPAAPGAHTCQGNPRVPIAVDLGEAIGERQLVDGACDPGEAAATTAFCVDGSVRWKP